jgi:hypothetical protein
MELSRRPRALWHATAPSMPPHEGSVTTSPRQLPSIRSFGRCSKALTRAARVSAPNRAISLRCPKWMARHPAMSAAADGFGQALGAAVRERAILRFDHHAQHRLGPGSTNQYAAAAVEFLRDALLLCREPTV